MCSLFSRCEHRLCGTVSLTLTVLVTFWARHSANFLAAGILLLGWWLDTLMLTLTHERFPLQDKPLPDILFDTTPFYYYGRTFSEAYIGVQTICFVFLLIFHPEREIILRRFMFILGIVYLMRTVAFTSTQLPCPFMTSSCVSKLDGNISTAQFVSQVFMRSFEYSFFTGFLSLSAPGLCGDYIFSGHTALIITGYLFINTYFFMDKQANELFLFILEALHLLLSAAAVLCVIASRQNYTVDVLLSYYIVTQLFWSYHSLCLEKYMFQELIERYQEEQSSKLVSSEEGTLQDQEQTKGGLMIREDPNFISQVWWWPIFIYLEIIKRPPDPSNDDSKQSYSSDKVYICLLSCCSSRSSTQSQHGKQTNDHDLQV